MHIVGEVRNVGDANAKYIQVNFNFFDASNRLLSTDFTFTSVDILGPGEKSPFHESFSPPAGYDHYAISSISPSTSSTPGNHSFTTTVTNVFTDGIGAQHIVGQVTNNNTTTSEYVEVVATFYDGSGHIVDADFTFVNTDSKATLAAGQQASFELIESSGYPVSVSRALLTQSSTPPNSPPTAQVPTTITLAPNSSSGLTGVVRKFSATVQDQSGNAMPGITVRFQVTGANTASGSAVTGPGGTASFTYTGTAPGVDVVTAFADANGDGVRQADEPQSTASSSWTAPRAGYWMVGSTGAAFNFGDAVAAGGAQLPTGAVAKNIAPTPSGNGYWIVDNYGDVYALGDATFLGSNPALSANEQVTSLSPTPDGKGYWLFTSKGRVFTYGSARFLGDMAAVQLNGPVLGSVATPTGGGYYMVASDGGIFTFGDAAFTGSMGGQHLNKPVVGLAPNPKGAGYWLVASDGGIFAFGPGFRGSMGSTTLNKPVIGMVAYGNGYLMVASDGGIFDFSDKAFVGSLGSNPPFDPIVAVAPLSG